MDSQVPISRAAARRIVARLLDGTAPDEGLDLFTAGRARWIGSLREDFEDVAEGDRRVRIFNGRYGDGKTHLMKVTREMARELGFPVTYVPISSSVPLNRWDRLYQMIVRGIHTGGRPERLGLTSVLDPNDPDPAIAENFMARAETVRSLPGLHPDFATAIYRYATRQGSSVDTDQDLLTLRNWLEAQPVTRPALRALSISSAIDRHSGPTMLTSIVAVLRHFGLKGLLLLLDEVEGTLAQSKVARAQAYENLRLFIDRDAIPKNCLAVFSTTPEMFSDIDKGFRTYPALWSRIEPPGSSQRVNYRASLVDLTKTPLTSEDFLQIARHIREIHAVARDWQADDHVPDEYLQQAAELASSGDLTLVYSPTRVFVKLIAEELDLAEQDRSIKPSGADLRRRFQDVDDRLEQASAVQKWSEA